MLSVSYIELEFHMWSLLVWGVAQAVKDSWYLDWTIHYGHGRLPSHSSLSDLIWDTNALHDHFYRVFLKLMVSWSNKGGRSVEKGWTGGEFCVLKLLVLRRLRGQRCTTSVTSILRSKLLAENVAEFVAGVHLLKQRRSSTKFWKMPVINWCVFLSSILQFDIWFSIKHSLLMFALRSSYFPSRSSSVASLMEIYTQP